MYSVRAAFDSYFYWGVFIFVTAFTGYFLVSMISIAGAEEELGYRSNTMYIGYMPQTSYLQHQGTATIELIEEEY